MAMITLNVRSASEKSEVAKTISINGYDLMIGTVDDFMDIIDLDKIDDEKEVIKMVLKSYKQIKPLIMDIFPELTEEDYRNVSVADLVAVIPQIGLSIIENIKLSKN